MKYGFNLLLWTGHVTDEHAPVLKTLKRTGYDSVEVPIFEGTIDSYARLGERLARMDLDVTTVSVLGAGHDPLSDDKMERQAAVERTNWVIDCTKALGGSIIAGPMHSELGRFTGRGPTADERKRGIEFHRRVGDDAGKHGMSFALEAVNRFNATSSTRWISWPAIWTKSIIPQSKGCTIHSMPISRRRTRSPP